MSKNNTLGFAGDMSIEEILKIIATHAATQAVGDFVPPLKILIKAYKTIKSKAELKDIRGAIDNVSKYFDARIDSEISELRPLIDSLKSKVSEGMTSEELLQIQGELKSGLSAFITEEQKRVLQYGHSVDVKKTSAIILFLEFSMDEEEQSIVENLIDDLKAKQGVEDIEDFFVSDSSITINFDEYVKKEAVERDCVNPIVKHFESISKSHIKAVAYAY